jgi:hypothetical protein
MGRWGMGEVGDGEVGDGEVGDGEVAVTPGRGGGGPHAAARGSRSRRLSPGRRKALAPRSRFMAGDRGWLSPRSPRPGPHPGSAGRPGPDVLAFLQGGRAVGLEVHGAWTGRRTKSLSPAVPWGTDGAGDRGMSGGGGGGGGDEDRPGWP